LGIVKSFYSIFPKDGVIPYMEEIKKTCTRCGRELLISMFQVRKDRKNLHKSHCKDCCATKCRTWQKHNKERLKKLRKQNYWNRVEEHRKDTREWRRRNPEQKLIQGAVERSRKFNLPFDLKADDIKIPEFCPVLGIPIAPNIGGKRANDNSPTLDRIIPEKGYIKGNIAVISHRANTIKNCGTVEEHQKIIQYMLTCASAS
jgi:hypothetical protein